MKCRHCKTPLQYTFLDLGFAALSNAYLIKSDLQNPEKHYPLKIKICNNCWLAQTEDYAQADELFSSDYAYFSGISKSWLDHASIYCERISDELNLDGESLVIEVASNDGYLLRNFVAKSIPCLGIEPTASTADASEKLGVTTLRQFFGEKLGRHLADEGKQADLIIGNNVYAHVPDINDFTRGLKAALKPSGTITLEFPHLMRLLEFGQFDTIYHEHFSYLSLFTVCKVFTAAELRVFKVEELSTHGGSLRIYGCHEENSRETDVSVENILLEEKKQGLQDLEVYLTFQPRAEKIKNDFLEFLIEQKKAGKSVAAYGAAAKGNTLLNYAGVKPDLLSFVCDAAEAKQGKFMPGSHIPILHPDKIKEHKPNFIVILPWNIAGEVIKQNEFVKDWGGKFVTAIPELSVI